MTRWVNSANETEAAKTSILMVTLVDLDFSSGHIYAHDAIGTLPFNGHNFLGVGVFGGIGLIEEDTDVVSKPITLTLDGVDPSLITSAMTETYQGRTAIVYVGILNALTMQWIANPETAWSGRMDVMAIDIEQNSARITLNCESRLRQAPRISLMTDPDQQIAFGGDTFFNLLPYIPNFKSNWGGAGPQSFLAPPRTPPSRTNQP